MPCLTLQGCKPEQLSPAVLVRVARLLETDGQMVQVGRGRLLLYVETLRISAHQHCASVPTQTNSSLPTNSAAS